MKTLIKIIVCVVVSYCVAAVYHYAYAGNGGEGGNTQCQGNGNPNSPCIPTDGDTGGGGDNNNGGNNTTINSYGGNATVGDIINRNNNTLTNTVDANLNNTIGDITNRNVNTNTNTNTIGDITNRNVNTNTIGDITNKNTANGGDATATVGDITNKNVAKGGDANASADSNSNSNASATGGNGGNANSSNGDQVVNVKFEDSPNHINPPTAPTLNGKLTDHGDKLKIKTMGSVFGMKTSFTDKEAKLLGGGASDAKIEFAVFAKFGATKEIKLGVDYAPETIKPMGYIYVIPNGPDCTLAQLQGKLMTAAMSIGASYIEVKDDSGAYLESGSWSIGFGGGASIISNGGQVAMAPSGGTGYGKAKSNNEMRPAVMAAVYGFETKADSETLPYIPLDDEIDRYHRSNR